MEALTPGHLLLIIVAFMLLFGYKKLPDASRSLGRSLRIFKSEMHELDHGEAVGAPTSTDSALTVEELESQARQADAEATALRAEAQAAAGDSGVLGH